jgi:hypothetical protein
MEPGIIMLIDYIDEILQNLREMILRKNADYGDQNLVEGGLTGITLRIKDKCNRRIIQDYAKGDNSLKRKVDSDLLEIAGYAVNAVRLIREDLI